MRKHIIAMGGGVLLPDTGNTKLERYVLEAADRTRPCLLFVSTASGDDINYLIQFYETYCKLECAPHERPRAPTGSVAFVSCCRRRLGRSARRRSWARAACSRNMSSPKSRSKVRRTRSFRTAASRTCRSLLPASACARCLRRGRRLSTRAPRPAERSRRTKSASSLRCQRNDLFEAKRLTRESENLR